ncbi:MAG TPA: LPS export ABC transporter periplasmic protein LptC [Stellaceae bacterium]|nr:LPS export ABC transporter periplasmic protein LptC [Stellaceae bacterium]
MIGRHGPRAISASTRGHFAGVLADWLARLPGNRYSRRVALLKVALPAIGGSLLLLVMTWPRVAPLFDRFRFAAIDLREARELRMINPRYVGTDRNGHPFVVTAAVGRQVPQRDDVMSLDQPVANLESHSGAKIVVTANTGVYQTQTQFLDAFGKVTVNHENGSTFVTSSARLDAANDAAEGHDPVEGHGPQGDITAQGFRVIDKGDIVVFTGKSNLTLKSTKPEAQPAAATPGVGVPAPVAQAAAQLEAKVEPKSSRALHAPTKQAPRHAGKTPAHSKPAAKRPG